LNDWLYTTAPGESIMGIALRQLGDDRRWQEIRALNADQFPDILPHDYYPVGTVLNMPPKDGRDSEDQDLNNETEIRNLPWHSAQQDRWEAALRWPHAVDATVRG